MSTSELCPRGGLLCNAVQKHLKSSRLMALAFRCERLRAQKRSLQLPTLLRRRPSAVSSRPNRSSLRSRAIGWSSARGRPRQRASATPLSGGCQSQ